jgi:hypothetical protein
MAKDETVAARQQAGPRPVARGRTVMAVAMAVAAASPALAGGIASAAPIQDRVVQGGSLHLAQTGPLKSPAPGGTAAPRLPASTPAPAPAFALRAEDAARTPPLQPDRAVRVQLRRGQSAFFRVAPEAGGHYTVATRRLVGGVDTVLATLDAKGVVVSEDDDGGEGLASRIEVRPEDNAALVRAGTVSDAGGTFEVVLTRDTPTPPPDFATNAADAARRPPLAPGQPVHLRLRRNQQAFFALPEERRDMIAVTRNLGRGTDTVLALLDAGGTVLAEDDDGGENLASLLPVSEPAKGPLILRAGSLGDASGEFDLVLEREAPAPPPDFPTTLEQARARGPLVPGTSVQITLQRRQSAIFALPEGQALEAVTRNLRNGADTTLALLDAQGAVILEDDDGAGELASRVATTEAERPAAFLRASVLGGQRGSFEVVLRSAPPAAPVTAPVGSVEEAAQRPPLRVGEAISLRLAAGETAVFALPHDGRPAIALTFGLGREADTVLELLDAGGNAVTENDDGGDGLSSRLDVPAEPQPAFLRAKLLNNQAGSFQLVLVHPATP